MYPIAFVTTCKGRLHHIQQTLPKIIAESPVEIILVDYGCPDNTADWVEHNYPSVKVVRVDDDPGFCLPRARNIGAAQTSMPWLCFIDADIKVQSGWLEWMRQHLRDGYFYLAGRDDEPEIAGTFLCPREAFLKVGGYDEAFRGWGGEDSDLYLRLLEEACVHGAHYPSHFIEPISHADDERTTFHAIKDVAIQNLINRCYIKVKSHLRSCGIRDIPFETRRHLLNCISDNLRHHKTKRETFALRLQARHLLTEDGQVEDLSLELAQRRRFGLFGARKTLVRIRARDASAADR